VIDKKFQLLPLLGGYVPELYRAAVDGVLSLKLWIIVFSGYRQSTN
jgi:hypothetical protein